MKKKPKIPRAVIGTVLVFVVLLSVFMAGHDLWRQKQAQDTFEDLAELVTAPEDPVESQAESSAPEESTEAQEPQEETRNLSRLFEQNADCIGWVCIPGTAVDYPLMHTPEDSEKYLRKDFYGAYSVSGVPFLDGRCSQESANLIIYGHNMNNGTMFGSLKNYTDASYYAEHPTIELETAAGKGLYTIFSVMKVKKTMPGTVSLQQIRRQTFCTRSAMPGSVPSMTPGSSRRMASSSSPCPPVLVHPAGMGVCSLWLRKRNNQSTIGRFALGKAAFSDPLASAKRRQGGKKCSNENPRC